MSLALSQQSALEVMTPYRDLLESAIVHCGGTHLFEDVVDMVETGQMFFWPAEKSCLVTEVVDYPRKRLLHVFLAAGSLEEIKRMEPSIRAYGEYLGCDAVTLSGRKGWTKALKDMGYAHVHTTMGREINGTEI